MSSSDIDNNLVAPGVEELLWRIRDALAKQQKDDDAKSSSASSSTELREAWLGLSEGSAGFSPREVLSVIVPYLFQEGGGDEDDEPESQDQGIVESKRMEVDDDRSNGIGVHGRDSSRPWTSRGALSVLGFLVGCDANRYLPEASEVVRDEALRIFHSAGGETMAVSPELLNVIVHQLSSPSVSVSSNAATTLVTCCRTVGGDLRYATISAIGEAWHQQQLEMQASPSNRNQASTIAVRCANSLVDILCLEEGTNPKSSDLAASASSRVLLPMLGDVTDPLVQMSTLDLIERMARARPIHHWRAHWLFSEAVRDPILDMCGGTRLEPSSPDPLLGGPALRVVASLCRIAHDGSSSDLLGLSGGPILDGFYSALKSGYAASSGEMDRLALVDAISSFASASPGALQMVLNDPDIRRAWLSLSVAQPKLKSVVLYSVAMVLDPTISADPSGEGSSPDNALGMRLFSQFGQTNNDEATGLVLSLAKSVLPEVRLASYALLAAVAKLPTGGQLLFTHPDFLNFLLDRNEATKEGREARWELVRTVLTSPVTGLLAQDIVRKLEAYVKEGPHYVKVQRWELATD